MAELIRQMTEQTTTRLERIAALAEQGGLDAAVELVVESVVDGGVLQAFGTGHSQAFAMEIAGRAGGLIPTARVALSDLVVVGGQPASVLHDGSSLERDPAVVDALWALTDAGPADVFLIASNSGVNGSVVGYALAAKEHGHPVIAVTSLDHTARVTPKHPSGKRLSEIADVVIDNLAPYGDATLSLEGDIAGDIPVGAVSSMTAAFIAQLITILAAERLAASGATPPVYLSANIPGGDEHNHRLESRYGDRLRRHA
ncbi:putative phosphosugar-binding protein [Terracoccus luteus]|uniref:Putative phosphosugar-binding protein n=1 Tax=Terracoccus luteus TaxID=53356 RepID=A0A495XYS2_9MICO|nr:SIS domain-containing protein [Terracoccus luteus]RKT76888.1 putative phosphosugar-binding protein [Terracoccus luteus]